MRRCSVEVPREQQEGEGAQLGTRTRHPGYFQSLWIGRGRR